MSSILTNTSALTALQTLKNINGSLSKTQDEISTGKSISTSKDNAAVWSISKVMESDVSGIKSIQSSLSLGESTVSVARQAAEDVVSKLQDMQDLIVSAQGENVDRTTLNDQLSALRDGITKTIESAQFNGLNLLDGSSTTATSVLASLNRDSSGNVSTSSITVDRRNLTSGAYAAKAVFTGTTGASGNADTFATAIDGGASADLIIDNTTALAEGDSISITIGDKTATYTVKAADVVTGVTTEDMVATGLKAAIDDLGISGLQVVYDSGSPGQLTLNNTGTTDLAVTGSFRNEGAGELAGLDSLDISSASGASSAMSAISGLIKNATAAAAYYGSAETQISSQADFLSKLSDAMTTGIGSLVDADMEEASARLTALQTQQQLGIQALSIANQQPQTILSLFQ